MGLTYGVYMNVSGFSFWYLALIEPDHFCRIDGICHSSSAFGRFSPAAGTGYDPDDQRSAFVLRHLHAGPIQKHRMKKYYLIFGMCDESFSIRLYRRLSAGCRPRLVYVLGNAAKPLLLVFRFRVGRPFGSLIQLNTKGLDFVMTAIFIVIFLEQWLKEKRYDTALIGIGISACVWQYLGAMIFCFLPCLGFSVYCFFCVILWRKAGHAN